MMNTLTGPKHPRVWHDFEKRYNAHPIGRFRQSMLKCLIFIGVFGYGMLGNAVGNAGIHQMPQPIRVQNTYFGKLLPQRSQPNLIQLQPPRARRATNPAGPVLFLPDPSLCGLKLSEHGASPVKQNCQFPQALPGHASWSNRNRLWQIVLANNSLIERACLFGRLQPVPQTKMGRFPTHRPVCAIPEGAIHLVLAVAPYRPHAETRTWIDFWDIARHPGKRALRLDPQSTLEIALLADHVRPADIYRVLSTPQGVAHALRKLDQIRPYIVWWRTAADITRIMRNDAALMVVAPMEVLPSLASTSPFIPQPNTVIEQRISWGVSTAIGHDKAVRLARIIARAPPQIASEHWQNSKQYLGKTFVISDRFWSENGAQIREQFNRWIVATR